MRATFPPILSSLILST